MLEQIRIQNLAIIDDLTIEFGKGLTILTGETGAGKSIIIGALNLILGERASTDDIRSGYSSAEVEALFSINNNKPLLDLLKQSEIPLEGSELILRRIITASGKGKIYGNNILIPLSTLKDIGNYLVDIHGQHQHQSLLSQQTHIDVLDDYAAHTKLMNTFTQLYNSYLHLKQKYNSLLTDDREIERMKSILEFQINEIEMSKLVEGEDVQIAAERERLLNAEKLIQNASYAYNLLYEGNGLEASILKHLSTVHSAISDIEKIDNSIKQTNNDLENAIYQIQEVAKALLQYKESITAEPHRLEEVQQRLDLIKSLKKKYGGTITEILVTCERLKKELGCLQKRDEDIAETDKQLTIVKEQLAAAAKQLSDSRIEFAKKFEQAIISELQQLNMPNVNFKVKIGHSEAKEGEGIFIEEKWLELNEKGIDIIEFLISPNIGEELKPLQKIASGGELSRIMLALKTIMASKDKIPVLVFDEIDVGISGATGDKVGEKLSQLGKSHQVICITHLPQIAAKADFHFAVTKQSEAQRTLTSVKTLSMEERVVEISRLIEGETKSPIGLEYAKKLLEAKLSSEQ